MQSTIPNPARELVSCGSWIIVSRETGKPVFETFEQRIAQAVNQAHYEVLTAYAWLVRLNKTLNP